MIWSMLVQCKGVEDQATTKATAESLNRLGHPELIVRSETEPAMLAFRDDVIKELKELWVSEYSRQLQQNTVLRQLAWWRTPSSW